MKDVMIASFVLAIVVATYFNAHLLLFDRAEWHNEMTIKYYNLGRNDDATYHAEQSLDIKPNDQAKNNLANIYLNNHQYAKALVILEQINDDYKNHAIGKVYLFEEKYEEAIEYMEKQLTKPTPGTYNHLATAYYNSGYIKKADELFLYGLRESILKRNLRQIQYALAGLSVTRESDIFNLLATISYPQNLQELPINRI